MKYVSVDGTCWPVDLPDDPDEYTLGWRLRYQPSSITPKEMLSIASILSSYEYLTHPGITQGHAVAALKRARKARASASHPGRCPHGDDTCPCQDGDLCHYEGDDPMRCPLSGVVGCTAHPGRAGEGR